MCDEEGKMDAALTATLALVTAVLGYALAESRHKREIGAKMVDLAVQILGQPLRKEVQPLRDWAVSVLAKYAKELDVPLPAPAQAALNGEPFYLDAVFTAKATSRAHFRSK